nr:ORF24 [Acipenserid herpesvirus 1]
MSQRLPYIHQTNESVQHLGVSVKALLSRPPNPHDLSYEDTCSLHYSSTPFRAPLKNCPCVNFIGLSQVNFETMWGFKSPQKKSRHLLNKLYEQGLLTDLFITPVNFNNLHFAKQTLAVLDTQAYLLETNFFCQLTPQDFLYNMDFLQWSTLTSNLWYIKDLSAFHPVIYELLDQLMLRSGLTAHAVAVGYTSAPYWGPLTPLFTVLPRLFDHLAFNLTLPAMTELKAGVMSEIDKLLTELNARTDIPVSSPIHAREGLIHLCTRALGLEIEPDDESVDLLIWSVQHGQNLALRDLFCLLVIRVDSAILSITPSDHLKLLCNIIYHLLDRTTVSSLFFFTWLSLAFVYIWGHIDKWPVTHRRPTNALTGAIFYHHLNQEVDPHPCVHFAYPTDMEYFPVFHILPELRTALLYAPNPSFNPVICYLKREKQLDPPELLRWRGVLAPPTEGVYCRPALGVLKRAWEIILAEPPVDVTGWVHGWHPHNPAKWKAHPPLLEIDYQATPPLNDEDVLSSIFVGPYSRQPLTRGQLVPQYLNSFKSSLLQYMGWKAAHTPGYLLYKRHRFLLAANFPHTPSLLAKTQNLPIPPGIDVILNLSLPEHQERFKEFIREDTTYEFINPHQLPAVQVVNATMIACDAILCGSLQLLQGNRPLGRPSDDTIIFRIYAWFLFVTLPALLKKPHPQVNEAWVDVYIDLAERVSVVTRHFRPRQTHGPAKYYQGCIAHLPQPKLAVSHVWVLMTHLFPELKQQTYKSLFVIQFFIKHFLTQLPFILDWPDRATCDVPWIMFNAGIHRVRLWEANYSHKPPVNFAAFEPVFAGPVTSDHARHLSSFFSALLSTAVGRQMAGVVTQSV